MSPALKSSRAGNAELLGGVAERVEDRPSAAAAARPAIRRPRRATRSSPRVVVLGLLEIGQHVVPAPAGIAELAPAVVVGRLAAHVDHAVDRGAAAQHLAARIGERAAVEPGLGLGLSSSSRCADCRCSRGSRPGYGSSDSCPCRRPRAAGRACRIGRQAVGEHAAGGAGADDDVVEFVHGLAPRRIPGSPRRSKHFLGRRATYRREFEGKLA